MEARAVWEAAIAGWFGSGPAFPERLTLSFAKVADLAYGENPHQQAAYYSERGARRHLLSEVDQLGGKELSFNNLADRGRPALRILWDRERRAEPVGERDLKRVLGGVLVQERDTGIDYREEMSVVAGEPTEEQWGDLLFAWRVCKHVSSNAIVIARDLHTIGVGAGQMSRVDAVRIALEKAREHGHELEGAVLASDAFFPFADGPKLALDAGIAAIVQPGGSKRDDEVTAVVQEAGAGMVLTGKRHFRH